MFRSSIIWYLTRRHLRLSSHERGVSLVTMIAFGVVLFTSIAAVMILSILNGFHALVEDRIMNKDAHIVIYGIGNGISNYAQRMEDIRTIPGVQNVFPFENREGLLKGAVRTRGVLLKALPRDFMRKDAGFTRQFRLVEGSFAFESESDIVVGEALANYIGAYVGDYVNATVYSEKYFTLSYQFRVIGLFSAGDKSLDGGLAFIPFDATEKLFFRRGTAFGIGVRLTDPYRSAEIRDQVRELVPQPAYTWQELSRNQVIALQNEKFIFEVLLFVFFVVIFLNVLSTMMGMVMDRRYDIAILKAMGLGPRAIRWVFLWDGMLIGVIGTSVGIGIGVVLSLWLDGILRFLEFVVNATRQGSYGLLSLFARVEQPEPFYFFERSVYYIQTFPIKILWWDLVFVFFLMLTCCLLAVVFPATRAGAMRPLEVLRGE